jgi:hypothetical protein
VGKISLIIAHDSRKNAQARMPVPPVLSYLLALPAHDVGVDAFAARLPVGA